VSNPGQGRDPLMPERLFTTTALWMKAQVYRNFSPLEKASAFPPFSPMTSQAGAPTGFPESHCDISPPRATATAPAPLTAPGCLIRDKHLNLQDVFVDASSAHRSL